MYKAFPIPIITFSVIHGYREAIATTDIVQVLLARGVNHRVIPEDMGSNDLDTPQKDPARPASKSVDQASAWCNEGYRGRLAESLHLSHRYLLRSPDCLKIVSARRLQAASANGMPEPVKLPFYLIGQNHAAKMVMSNVFTHVAMQQKTPMVMEFAGLSGHGKTELARKMGDILSAKTTTIDYTRQTTIFGLFGPTSGFVNQQQGSQLNNFLAVNDGLRSVVFLDEFDKTNERVRNALLLVTERGKSTIL